MARTVADRETWEVARRELLAQEKAFTRAAERLAAARRALPRYAVTSPYSFHSRDGVKTLGDLFEVHSQLIVQHFMMAPGAMAGCPMCSFWADGYDPMVVHLRQRDIAFVAVSRAPLHEIDAYRARMGWSFPWVSSGGSSFDTDFGVYATDEAVAARTWRYNYRDQPIASRDMPGISVFERSAEGTVFHTYSTYGRGLEMTNAAYAYMDLTPNGRHEGDLPFPMAWVRRHDEYGR